MLTPSRRSSTSPLALYIHVPFCRSRCTYCDFNTYAGQQRLMAPYVQALEREITLVAGTECYAADTVFWGGGTPSLLPVAAITRVLQCCAASFTLAPDAEITLEANPGTVDQDYLTVLRQAGVNRLSFGMQSAHEHELRLFGRQHHTTDVFAAVRMARRAGFASISLDLIFGIPGQTLTTWQHTLETALSMNPDHLSLYSLSVESETLMQHWIARGIVSSPDPDLAADMYEWASERLFQAGFLQYEISNWARPGQTCRHNLHYWRGDSYLGLGAGSHGYAAGIRYANTLRPADYIQRIMAQGAARSFPLSDAADIVETIDPARAMSEVMFMGLRLTAEGISPQLFQERFGTALWTVYGPQLDRLIGLGLLEQTADAVRLTPRGRLLGNLVFAEFV